MKWGPVSLSTRIPNCLVGNIVLLWAQPQRRPHGEAACLLGLPAVIRGSEKTCKEISWIPPKLTKFPVVSSLFCIWTLENQAQLCLSCQKKNPKMICNICFIISSLYAGVMFITRSYIGTATHTHIVYIVYVYIHSGSNNYLIPCWFCRFAHLQRMELCIILIIGTC